MLYMLRKLLPRAQLVAQFRPLTADIDRSARTDAALISLGALSIYTLEMRNAVCGIVRTGASTRWLGRGART
jgi:hypothetical protein